MFSDNRSHYVSRHLYVQHRPHPAYLQLACVPERNEKIFSLSGTQLRRLYRVLRYFVVRVVVRPGRLYTHLLRSRRYTLSFTTYVMLMPLRICPSPLLHCHLYCRCFLYFLPRPRLSLFACASLSFSSFSYLCVCGCASLT